MIMKTIIGLLMLVLTVAGCASRRYDTSVVALPSSVGTAAWMVVRIDHQTGQSWYWRGDSTPQSKPEWHPIADTSGTSQK
jgi:type IV pilus biogenesis protein CpaD/CtpE